MDVHLTHRIRAEDDEVDEYNRQMYATVKKMLINDLTQISCACMPFPLAGT